MPFLAKFTVRRGKANNPAAITLTAGAAEPQSDTISINIDANALSKGEALLMLADLRSHIERGKWPPL